MFWSAIGEGDWVKSRRPIHHSLLGAPIPEGTRGVVHGTSWSRLEVEFEGYSASRVQARASELSLVRRAGGVERFRRSSHRRMIIQVGCLIAIAAPIVWYAVQYWMYYRTFDGFIPALAVGAVESAGDLLVAIVADPVRGLLFLMVTGVIARLAFGARRK